jgi:hypothetical protein
LKLSSVNVAVSSFAALAGVIIAGWQAFGPSHGVEAPPVNVTLTVPQTVPVVTKGNIDSISTSSVNLAQDASFAAADKSEAGRYPFSSIFDGKPESYITLSGNDSELNVMVNFPGDAAREVTAISYTPPPGVSPEKMATSVDVVVLPDTDMGAVGHPVYSFSLQTTPGTQTFAIPGHNAGKAVLLRIAGNPSTKGIAIGDFGIIREHIAP